MLMVINQHGVATGWALASGNVQERWVAELLCSTRAGVPGVQGPLDDRGAQAQGETTRGVDGSRAQRRYRVKQAHPERLRLSWGTIGVRTGRKLTVPRSAHCPKERLVPRRRWLSWPARWLKQPLQT